MKQCLFSSEKTDLRLGTGLGSFIKDINYWKFLLTVKNHIFMGSNNTKSGWKGQNVGVAEMSEFQ